jgi:hypothetical protein
VYSTTGGGTLLPYTMVTGGGFASAVAIGMTTEFKIIFIHFIMCSPFCRGYLHHNVNDNVNDNDNDNNNSNYRYVSINP